jgi:hypothetical protein
MVVWLPMQFKVKRVNGSVRLIDRSEDLMVISESQRLEPSLASVEERHDRSNAISEGFDLSAR